MDHTIKLEQHTWKNYFDHVSQQLAGKCVEIDVSSLALGSQVVAAWLPVLGVTYEEQSDLLSIMTEGLDHMIRHPREIFAQTAHNALQSVRITDADGTVQIVRFRDPVALPAP